MTEIFFHVVNMSITASILAAVVLLLRLLLKKAPKWISVLLWGLVAIRLVFPFAIESPFSLIPETDWVVQETMVEEDKFIYSAPDTTSADDTTPVKDIPVYYYPTEPAIEIHREFSVSFMLCCIWLAGIVVLILHTVISSTRLRRSVATAIRIKDNVWESSAVDSPFVLGLIRPRIYVPRGMTEENLTYVIAHEEAHIRRRDHWWKPFGFLLLTIHWFNPVLWLAYILLCRDIEMACDERVIKEYDEVQRADYSEALLNCSVNRKMISACPLAFGEVGVKERIKSVLNYKKPAFWIIITAIIVCAIVAVCFLTNPQSKADAPDGSYTLEIYFDLDYELTAPLKESNDVKVVIDDLMNVWVYDGKQLMSGGLYKEIELNNRNFDVLFENTAVDIGLIMDLRKSVRSSWVMTYTASENGHHPYLIIVDDDEQVYLVVADYTGGMPIRVSGVFKLHKNVPEQLEAIDFVDFIENQDGMYSYVDRFIEHKDFPGVSFHYTPQKIIAKTAAGEHAILSEETIWNCYFSDVTGDGKADLCATVTKTKPFIARRVVVYDYAERRKYEFSDRDGNHYILSNENGFLTVNRYANAEAYENEPASKGSLTIINGNLYLFVYAMNTPAENNPITLDDVIALTAKGENLTWSDFAGYSHTDIGSGLYIWHLPIDEVFSVKVGGGSIMSAPAYIYLCAGSGDAEKRIDIRDGGVQEFIHLQQKNNIAPTDITDEDKENFSYTILTDSLEFTDPKTQIYSKMLNAIDYYNSAHIEFYPYMLNSNMKVVCELDLDSGKAYQASYINGKLTQEYFSDGETVSGLNHKQKYYDADYCEAFTREDSGAISLSDRVTIGEDGLPCYYYRRNVTNCPLSSYTLFPQELAFSYLANFSRWTIVEETTFLGRQCIVIEGNNSPYISDKHNANTFRLTVDKETGIVLMLTGEKNGKATKMIEVTALELGISSVYQVILTDIDLSEYSIK